MFVRTGRLEVDPSRIDAVVETVRDNLDNYRAIDGFRAFRVNVNRETGKIMGQSYWDSREAMHAGDEVGQRARAAAVEAGGNPPQPLVEEWELALDESA
jgi:heme-degrading monooxygenase HmoA